MKINSGCGILIYSAWQGLSSEKSCGSYKLFSGKLSLLDELTSRKKTFKVDFTNADGDTLFHTITRQQQPPPTSRHLMEVTELLMKKGYRYVLF